MKFLACDPSKKMPGFRILLGAACSIQVGLLLQPNPLPCLCCGVSLGNPVCKARIEDSHIIVFIRQWMAAFRRSTDLTLYNGVCNIIANGIYSPLKESSAFSNEANATLRHAALLRDTVGSHPSARCSMSMTHPAWAARVRICSSLD